MKAIGIRELHLRTGRWIRHAANGASVIVTDRDRPVAVLKPFDSDSTAKPLPNREGKIERRSRIAVDSVTYQRELRERA